MTHITNTEYFQMADDKIKDLIRCLLPDIHGKARTKIVPRRAFNRQYKTGIGMYLGRPQ